MKMFSGFERHYSRRMKYFIFIALILTLPLYSAEKIPLELKDVGVFEHLGEKIDLGLTFTEENGKDVALSSFFDGKRPVLLFLIYYNCPNLCHFLLDGVTQTLKNVHWTVGKEFDVVLVSIDPTETPKMSREKKEFRVAQYERSESKAGWHFLTGKEEQIRALANQVGFGYSWDKDQKQYAHAAVFFVVTPEGKISRYLYGIQFKPLDLRLALLEAGEGKIGNVVDKLLLFCYHYDPKTRKYAIFAKNLMSLAGAITVLLLIILFIFLVKRKRQRK